MKQSNIECVTATDLVEHLLGVVAKNHKKTRAGSMRGGVKEASKLYGIDPQELSNVVYGYRKPSPRILEAEGLEAVTVYVRKDQSQGK